MRRLAPHQQPKQLELFWLLMGRQPTHVDSHQHVHKHEPFSGVIASFARDLGVPLRGHDRRVHYCGSFYGQTGKGEPLHEAITVSALATLFAKLPEGVTELGCHPGEGTQDDFPYGVERTIELRTLCDR